MKKIIAIILIFTFLLSLCGCKEEEKQKKPTANPDLPLCATKNFETLEIWHNSSKEAITVTKQKDFEFLDKYYYSHPVDLEEFKGMLIFSKTTILKLISDKFEMEFYLLSDGTIIEKVMSGDSGAGETGYSAYTADEKYLLNENRLNKLLEKYAPKEEIESKPQNESSKVTSSKVTSSKPESQKTESKKEEPYETVDRKNVLPTVKHFEKEQVRFYDMLLLKNGNYAVSGLSEIGDNISSAIYIFDKKSAIKGRYFFEYGYGFNKISETSEGGFLGISNETSSVIKISKDFKTEWAFAFDDPRNTNHGYAVAEINPDCYAVLYANGPENRHLILKYISSNGELIEEVDFMNKFDSSQADIIPDGKGGFYIFTACDPTLAANFNLVKKAYDESNSVDAAVMHFNKDKKLDFVKTVGSKGDDWVEEAAVDSDGNMYLAIATDWNKTDKFWNISYKPYRSIRRMLVKLDKKGNIKYKSPLSNDGMAVDEVRGIEIKNGKAYVVGITCYFDDYQKKYPCIQIPSWKEGDRIFAVYTLCVSNKTGKELYRNVFRSDIENAPFSSVMLGNGNLIILGRVSYIDNPFNLKLSQEAHHISALFTYKNIE